MRNFFYFFHAAQDPNVAEVFRAFGMSREDRGGDFITHKLIIKKGATIDRKMLRSL